MSKQLGRISGPLLNANLLRDGNDLRFENQLLYLDVTSKTLSINSTPINKELFVNGTLRTDFILIDAPKINVGNLELGPDDLIKATSGTIIMNASDYVSTKEIQTLNLSITNNAITAITPDSQIEFRPTGTLEIHANTNVTGNLHSTGDITSDGSIIFGSNSSDSVTLAADVDSNITPDQDLLYSLGTSNKKWNQLHSKNYFGTLINTGTLVYAGLNTALRPGKTWFVSSNGLDTNVGNHENGTYLTVKKALSVATAGDTVFIYPGTYPEIFPLTVPAGVTVKGFSLRAVIIQPTAGTNTNNAFLLNGETAVSDLTVANFYQGYAFSFAVGAKITSRSPYIQNCSVITSGTLLESQSIIDGGFLSEIYDAALDGGDALSTYILNIDGGTSQLNDAIGFSSGTAGRGALVDGSVVDATSKEASMLFHSCTFITPGVNAVTMTNGVRVEWVNSFTYFANCGLYAIQGVLGFASLGVKFGAEVRAITSASAYGTYGAIATGADTLMYLIQYNFSYIGSGADSSNDRTLVIQDNETVELNNGKIYFESVDQQGNYRVGKEFYIDYDTGTTSIDLTAGAVTGATGLVVGTYPNITVIDHSKIDTGDFVLRDNDILTKSLDFNFSAQSTQVNLNSNVQVDKNLSVDGDVTVGGVLTVGNQTSDTVEFTADVASDLLPDADNTRDLGSTLLRWNHAYLKKVYAGNITVDSDQIRSSNLNGNLILASLSAKVTTTSSDLVIGQDLTILGHGYLANTVIIGNVIHTGNYQSNQPQIIAGDRLITEDSQILVTEDGIILVLEDTYLNLGTTGQITRIGNTVITGNIRARSGGQIGNINFLGRTISSATITLAHATAAESIVVAGLTIKENTIATPLTIDIGNNYLKISGDNGVVVPIGDSTTREPNPEIGQFRINTDNFEGEVYCGDPTKGSNGWVPAKGLVGEASAQEVEESLNVWSLVLG